MYASDFYLNAHGNWLSTLLNAKQPAGSYEPNGGSLLHAFQASYFYTDWATAATACQFGRNGGPVLYLNRAGTTGAGLVFQWSSAQDTVGSVTINGSSVTYNTTSDGRLKPKREDFDPRDWLMETKVIKHNWLHEPDVWGYGVIAQDEVERFPQAIQVGEGELSQRGQKDENGEPLFTPWSADYSKYVAPLLRAWQLDRTELLARIEALEAKVG